MSGQAHSAATALRPRPLVVVVAAAVVLTLLSACGSAAPPQSAVWDALFGSALPPRDFFAEVYEQRERRVSAAERAHGAATPLELLFGEDVVWQTFAAAAERALLLENGADARLVRAVRLQSGATSTATVSPSVVRHINASFARRLHGEGFTLVLNKINARLPRVARLCAQLEREMLVGGNVNANLYASPPRSQGFDAHWDTMDAIIVQLEGKKKWSFYEPLFELSRYDQKRETRRDELVPRGEVVMEAGDVMYFPRGLVHECTTEADAHSVHITLGLEFPREATFEGHVHAIVRAAAMPGSPLRLDRTAFGACSYRDLLHCAALHLSDTRAPWRALFTPHPGYLPDARDALAERVRVRFDEMIALDASEVAAGCAGVGAGDLFARKRVGVHVDECADAEARAAAPMHRVHGRFQRAATQLRDALLGSLAPSQGADLSGAWRWLERILQTARDAADTLTQRERDVTAERQRERLGFAAVRSDVAAGEASAELRVGRVGADAQREADV